MKNFTISSLRDESALFLKGSMNLQRKNANEKKRILVFAAMALDLKQPDQGRDRKTWQPFPLPKDLGQM
jgi:hypothetical protein